MKIKKISEKERSRRTNISIHPEILRLAKRMAFERGLEGGVSELIRKLIEAEKDNPHLKFEEPTPAYAKFVQQLEKK